MKKIASKKNDIEIQFKVDTAEYNSAMKEMKGETSKLNKEFKLEQEQLKNTGTAVDKLESQVTFLGKKHEMAAKQVKVTEEQLDKAKRVYGENSKEVEKLENALLDAKIAHEKIGNEVSNTNAKLDVAKDKWKNASKSVEDFGKKAENAGKKFAPVSAAAGAGLAGMVGMAVKAGKSADDINTLAKTTGLATDQIQKMKYAADIIDVDFETIQGSLTKLTKGMGTAKDGTGAAADAFAQLGVSFKDDVTGELRNNEDVFYDSIDALGKMTNETERDALAMEIFGKSAQELNPLILGGADALREMGKAAEEKGLILSQEDLDSANEFNDVLDALSAEGMQSVLSLGTEIGRALMPLFKSLSGGIGEVLEWMRGLDEGTLTMIMTILGVVAVIAPLLIMVGKISFGISSLIALGGTLAPVIGAISLPVLGVVAAIAAAIAIGVLLYKNWDTIKIKAGEIFSNVSEKFQGIRSSISEAINGARDTVKGAIDKIKGFMDFKWSLPKLKLPSFGVTGKFGLNPPSVPKLSMNWNADGAIFTKPTIFNTSQGLQGVGEAGPEAVLPITKLAALIRDVMPEAYARNNTVLHEIGGNMNLNITGNGAGMLNDKAVAESVEKIIVKKISQDNRRLPNRAAIIPL